MGVIKRQGIQNTIVTYLGILLGFLNLIVLQPVFLTPEEIGLTRILFSFSSLVAVFLPLGIGPITVKYFPLFRNKEKRHYGFFGFMLLFPVVGFALTSLVLFLVRDFFIAQYITESKLFTEYFNYVMPLSFFLGLVSVFNLYCFSLFKTNFPSLLNDVIIRIFSMVVISVYFLKWITINQFIFFFVTVYGLQTIILLLYIFWIDRPGIRVNLHFLKQQDTSEIFGFGVLTSFTSVASLGLKYLDSILLGKFMPLAYVGIYSIAAFIPNIIEAPLNSLDKIASTKTANALALKNQAEVKEIYYKSCKYLLLAGGFLFLMININIESLLTFLPKDYSKGVHVILIISIGTLFNLAGGSSAAIIFNSDSYKFGAFLLILVVIIALACNVIFIPIFGMEGAAAATALSSIIYSSVKYFFILKHHKLQPYDRKTLLLAGLIVFCFIGNYFLPVLENPIADIIFRSGVITLVYMTGVYLFNIVPEFRSYLPFRRK